MKKFLGFDGLSRQKNGQHFSMNNSKFGHSYEAFTNLFGRNTSFVFSQLNYRVDLFNLAITGNFGLIRDSTNKFLTGFGRVNSLRIMDLSEVYCDC